MPIHDMNYFANGFVGYQEGPIGIHTADRRFHFYTIGRTGTGKSTMLANMIIQDLAAGRGLALIDPHGDLAESVLPFVPKKRKNQLVYFNPSDIEYPIGLNMFERVEPHERHLLASNLMSIFRKTWADFWGPRMGYLLHNALLALLEIQGSTLLGLVRLLSDKRFRERIVSRVSDPVVRHYWQREFAAFPERLLPEIVSPVQNKVGAYLTSNALRNILGQARTAIDFRQLINNRGILIVNLAKGRVGEDAANLLGSLIVTKLQVAAMQRANMPEADREDFYLYVDEFQNFTTESFADILAEARKYRLNLILAHQYLGQLDEHIRDAVLANAGTMAVFRIGPEDAKILEREFEPKYSWLDLTNLSPHSVYYKLVSQGTVREPHFANTLAPTSPAVADPKIYKQELIELSRRRYASPRSRVEEKIERFMDGE